MWVIGAMTLVVMALCTLAMSMNVFSMIDFGRTVGFPMSRSDMWRDGLVTWSPWFVTAPLIAALAVVFRFGRHHWLLVSVIHLVAIVAATLTVPHIQMYMCKEVFHGQLCAIVEASRLDTVPNMQWPLDQEQPMDVVFLNEPVIQFPSQTFDTFDIVSSGRLSHAIPYVVLASMVMGILAVKDLRSRDVVEAKLRTEVTNARLASLRMQLNPHFLFNTLNSVSAMVVSHPQRARKMLSQLSDLMRAAYQDIDRHEITLADEIALTKTYIAIQMVRFAGRIGVSIDVEKGISTAAVPVLCLQPIIENVFSHAVEKVNRKCELQVTAALRGSSVVLCVSDDGPGTSESQDAMLKRGVGLANIANRIKQLYGENGRFCAGTTNDYGFRVEIHIPLRWIE